MSHLPIQSSIKKLLTGRDQYIIPMYQRNYAWEDGEINQLIQDITDNLPKRGKPARNYYIGTLVVFERKAKEQASPLFETIDGQQRLTTLLLLAAYLQHRGVLPQMNNDDEFTIPDGKLRFDSREKSSYTLEFLLTKHLKDHPEELLHLEKTNHAILNGYRLIDKNLQHKADNELQAFADFLFDQVQVIRVKVPDHTDLNHYFEIMNNRGEQLEKHEILKANLLKALQGQTAAERCLHEVWEACSNMQKYVQMGFNTEQRSNIFGHDWSTFIPGNFEDLVANFKIKEAEEVTKQEGSADQKNLDSLNCIIIAAKQIIETKESKPGDESPDRFNPTVNFPNFLLHVLRVYFPGLDIPLDDKRLIPTFEEHLINKGADEVKKFTYALLKCKWLFDHYIIKRDFADGTGDWSLKHLKKTQDANSAYYRHTFEDPEGSRIQMLLAAFHVSSPTMVYKHWLSAALHYLFNHNRNQETVDAQHYLAHLESIARAFVFDRHLATPENKKDYYEIIYRNNGICRTQVAQLNAESLEQLLSFGKIENNLIFNYLDYLLWLKYKDTNQDKIKKFKFTFRSSVEHYYPQNPEKIPRMDAANLNAFGNLCLISHSKNSRLSNFPPDAKKSDYHGADTPIDSIKQYLMMEDTPTWNEAAIKKHGEAMIDTLIRSLYSNQP